MTFKFIKTYKQTGNSFIEETECKDRIEFIEAIAWWNFLLHDVFVCEELPDDNN